MSIDKVFIYNYFGVPIEKIKDFYKNIPDNIFNDYCNNNANIT